METERKKDMLSKKGLFFKYPMNYVFEEQRMVCLLIGIAISTAAFAVVNSVSSPSLLAGYKIGSDSISDVSVVSTSLIPRRITYEVVGEAYRNINAGGKVPLGLKNKKLRVLVTGGAGFVGSHLVDRLIEREDSVIVVDNFFTGRKENLLHHFRNPKFEMVRHDVVEPILLEVDQIYHLACPASPVHYKYNPVKTIKTNVMGTLNMLGLAKRVGARFLLTSTSEVYGDPLQHPQVETYWGNVNSIGVRSYYDEGSEQLRLWPWIINRGLNVEVRIARIFNTYGPRMCIDSIDDGRVESNFVAQVFVNSSFHI
ncbi:UDP-glucuronic acid decarboxylase 4-like isoform X2 [Nicotiana tomentosiformis]|uniref:UDP-glucuronic acid decarboxylase 4-like isoform X2 n=1 Tax=Nicotiana tomentosiformis TaxID=4098 RepID=UPI00388C8DB9